jgi:hypothetical protein
LRLQYQEISDECGFEGRLEWAGDEAKHLNRMDRDQ